MIFNDKDMYIGEAINHYGEFSESEVDFYKQLIPRKSTFVDIGANIGGITIPMGNHVGSQGLIYAFEPQRWIYYMLCGNIAINELKQVRCYNCALGEIGGYTRIIKTNYEEFYNYGSISTQNDLPLEISEQIQVLRLDDFNIQPHLIKIDAEGSELSILKGCVKTLKKHKPILSVESIHKHDEIVEFLNSQNYKYKLFMFKGYNSKNYFNNEKNVFVPPNVVSPNLICLPKEMSIKINDEIF